MPNKGGRPLKEINQNEFEKLCGLQCTKEEICGFFDITDKTLESWCKRTYENEDGEPMGFSEVFRQKRGKGKIALRRSQFRLAEKNANMAIFLGKQLLGQTDSGTYAVSIVDAEDDPLTKALKEEAEKMNEQC